MHRTINQTVAKRRMLTSEECIIGKEGDLGFYRGRKTRSHHDEGWRESYLSQRGSVEVSLILEYSVTILL